MTTVLDKETIRQKYAAERGIKYFMVSYTDLFGGQRAKLVPAQAINDMAVDGAGFAGFATWHASRITPPVREQRQLNPSLQASTGVYIIGKGDVAVIDPGPMLDEHFDASLASRKAAPGAIFAAFRGDELVGITSYLRPDPFQVWPNALVCGGAHCAA